MNIVDAVIILFLLMGAVVGFKQGAIKKTVSFVGLLVIIVISFMLKNNLSIILYENLPFFDFWGALKGVQVINIILYEVIAFLLVFSILLLLLKVIIAISGLAEKILKATIFLAIPSKILGIFVGFIEYYIYVFIGLFVISLPLFNFIDLNGSKLANSILHNTPVLSDLANDSVEIYNEVYDILEDRDDKSPKQLNQEVLTFMLERKTISYDSVKSLLDRNKIVVEDKNFIDKYK